MTNGVIKGDYVMAAVFCKYENFSEKNVKIFIGYGNSYEVCLNNETVKYCNLVRKESDIKIIPAMISSIIWGHIAGNAGRVYANIDAPKKYRYYIEIELKDGKHFYIKVDERHKECIEKCVDMKKYALGYGVTKYNFDNHEMSIEERNLHKSNFQSNKKILIPFAFLIGLTIWIGVIYTVGVKTDLIKVDNGDVNESDSVMREEIKVEGLEEESKVWGYYKDTKEAMNILTDELVNSEDSELENVRLIAEEIENKADNIWEYINGLERKEYNEKYYSVCQEYIVMCRIAAENIKEYTQDNDKEHLETAIECIKAGEESVESVEEYRRDFLRGIGCSDEEIERLVGEKE